MRFTLTLLMLAACASDAEVVDDAPAPLVKIADVGSATVADRAQIVGTIRLQQETQLSFTTPGRIASIAVEPGQNVRRGQRLAALDTTTVNADLTSARAEQRRADSDLTRSRKLFQQGWVTQARLDNVEAAAQAADARVEAAGFASRTARIDAPASGVILARMAEPGQTVDAGIPVLVFGNENAGYVLSVPLTDRMAAGRRIGEAATVTVSAIGDAEIPARLTELAARADPATGTFAAEFELASQDGLRSGQVGRVSLSAPDARAAVTIPTSAIFAARAGEALVWTYDRDKGIVSTRSIVPGPLTDAGVRVDAGLKGDEAIVIAGLDNLQQGMKVRIE